MTGVSGSGKSPIEAALARARDRLRRGGTDAVSELTRAAVRRSSRGADLEVEDDKGRTPHAVAMLRGDEEAMRRLKAAGAKVPTQLDRPGFGARMSALTASVKKVDPMICVPHVRAAVDRRRRP